MLVHRTIVVGLAAVGLAAALAPRTRPAPKQYKGISRDRITQISRGKEAAAIEGAQGYLQQHPGDLESMYVLAVAHGRLGQIDKAMGYVRQAVEAGLPVGRFVAGPRDLCQGLTESKAFREYLAAHPVKLIHGPMVGSVTHERARFWVRTAGEVPVQVLVSTVPEMTEPIRLALAQTSNADDYTAVVEATGLKPSTRYYYHVLLNGEAARIDPQASFRTFPVPGAKGRFRVAFGGGAGYTPEHEGMWNVLTSQGLTAFLAMGDNVYIDTPTDPATQRYCYYRRQSRPEYRRFVASAPIFSIWDDHDFGTNDCSGSEGLDDPPWKRPVWDVFRQNWANPSYGGGEKDLGVWYSFSIGDVDFIMLDCRFYRVGRGKPGGTMLGPVQKRWLLAQLREAKGTFKVLASSVPWAPGTKPGSKDTWDGFASEREEIFSFLAKHRIEGVFLISADRHRSDAWKIARPGAYDLYEASSSRLTNIHTHPIIKGSLFGYNAKCSFGLLTFDTTKDDPALTYDVINIDGKLIHTLPIKRSQLALPPAAAGG